MARFELRVLGSPHLLNGDDDPVDLPLGKPLAALCFLAVEPTAVRRSDLARLLWPSSSESRARASIRQALWLLRKHTDPDIVIERDGSLEVNPEVLGTDLAAFEADLVSGRLDDALSLWSGGLFIGFAIPDAPAWLQWADGVRSRWEAHLGRALEDRASTTTGPERVEWLTHAVDVRPYRAPAWLALVEAHVELRDLDGAEAALTQLRSVTDPDDHELVAEAEARVRLLRRSAYDDPSDRLVPEFVGRAGEFAELMAAWRSARSGRPRVVGITGPAGIGKSALAAETVRHCEADGAGGVETRAVRAEARLEYGVCASLIAELLRRPGAAGTSAASAEVLKSLVPSESSSPPLGSPRAAVLADALADLLAAVAHEAPLALLVDDAHWIDTASALVLLRAVRSLRDTPVLMLWTCRTEGTENTGLAALTDAVSSGNAVILELPPLGSSDVEEMVGLLLAGPEPGAFDDLARELHRHSGGVPLHIVELLQDLRDRGAISVDSKGRWRIAEDLGPTLGLRETLEETQESRVERLSAEARRLGDLLAQAFDPLSVEALQLRSALPAEECTRALSELFARDLVRWTRDDRVMLAHDSLRTAFEEDVASWPGGAAPPRLKWLSAAAGATLLLVGAWAVRGGAAEEGDPVYGGGTLMLRGADSILVFQPGAESGALRQVESRAIPEGVGVTTTVFHRAGGVWMGGSTRSHPVDPPAAVIWNGSSLDTLLAVPGDAAVRVVRPQGDAALLMVQHPDTSIYRAMVLRMNLAADRDTTVLAAGAGHYGTSGWSPDGRRILVTVDNTVDSVRMIDPSGRVSSEIEAPTPDLLGAVPCGEGAFIWATPPAQTVRTWLWLPSEGDVRPIDLGTEQISTAACSPDGSAVALIEADGLAEEERLVVRAFDGRELERVALTGRGAHWVEWQPDPEPAPVSVEIDATDLALERGARRRIEARALDVDGRETSAPFNWASTDPTVASVRADGTVIANRPGRATVSASVDGWLSDSLLVTVAQGDTTNALALVDSFPDLDRSRWTVHADSTPVPVRVEGRTALRLNGDGRYRDALDSREAFDLSQGGTVEILFRLREFNRRDRQRVQFCLDDTERVGRVPARFACLTWPAAEGFDFDSDAVLLQVPGGALGKIPLAGRLAPGEWNTLALQVRPDGTVSAIANDSVIAVHPAPLRMHPDARFHVAIAHAAVDTELLLREVSVWLEERYR